MNSEFYYRNSWQRFEYDPVLFEWVGHALPAARKSVVDPEYSEWLRCGGSWFVGVDALSNDSLGIVGNSKPLQGNAIGFCRQSLELPRFDLHRAQVSVCYPGYPQPGKSESADAYRYRIERDAAHVDGLLPEGPDRRRHLREHHSFILGIPMVDYSVDASPLVVWQGSHEIVRAAFKERYHDLPLENWGDEDVTDIYKQTRRQVFEGCERVEITAKPGEAFVVHRLALHGIAPWSTTATAGVDGRMICYFRPEIGGVEFWLNAP